MLTTPDKQGNANIEADSHLVEDLLGVIKSGTSQKGAS